MRSSTAFRWNTRIRAPCWTQGKNTSKLLELFEAFFKIIQSSLEPVLKVRPEYTSTLQHRQISSEFLLRTKGTSQHASSRQAIPLPPFRLLSCQRQRKPPTLVHLTPSNAEGLKWDFFLLSFHLRTSSHYRISSRIEKDLYDFNASLFTYIADISLDVQAVQPFRMQSFRNGYYWCSNKKSINVSWAAGHAIEDWYKRTETGAVQRKAFRISLLLHISFSSDSYFHTSSLFSFKWRTRNPQLCFLQNVS